MVIIIPGNSRYKGNDPYIFVSYAHMDHKAVFKEIKRFTDAGFNVWYDEGINPGNEWPQEIANALDKCTLFVVMVTPNSIVRQNVQNEINFALEKRLPCIAIHLRKTKLPSAMMLQMGSLHAIMKYNMTEEEYNYKYISAFEYYGLKRGKGHGEYIQKNNTSKYKKTIALCAGIGLVLAGVIAGVIAVSSGCSKTNTALKEPMSVETVLSDEISSAVSEQMTQVQTVEGNPYSAISDSVKAARAGMLKMKKDILNEKESGLLPSYITDNVVLKDSAYIYDNACAAMDFQENGNVAFYTAVLDAFSYASEKDRYKPGRLRNAYAAGSLYYKDDQGKESAKLTGWYDQGWNEDPTQVGCNVGNTSFAVLAMLHSDQLYNEDEYTDTAKTLMDWVLYECSDGSSGFTAGINGWPEANKETVLTYKSTSDNIKAYSAFKRLYDVTGDEKYKKGADSALAFVKSMYDKEGSYFCTCTKYDGKTPDYSIVSLETQVLAALALGDDFKEFEPVLDTIKSMKTPEGAYPYCKENKNGGFWCEGTAMAALMYNLRGNEIAYKEAMLALVNEQRDDGLLPSASVSRLSTGIWIDSENEQEYTDCAQLAPTAWFTLAYDGFNPFSFDIEE